MASNTYTALYSTTVSGTSTTTVTFSSIPATYTDLRLVINGGAVIGTAFPYIIFNSDTGSNYSGTAVLGNGGSSFQESNTSYTKNGNFSAAFGTNLSGIYIIDILGYADYSRNRTTLWSMNCIDSSGYSGTGIAGTLWRNTTTAVNQIDVKLTNSGTDYAFANNTTVTLYGIRAEGVSPAPKATGGTVYSDSTYYYHVFGATGVFTPSTSLTADVMVVAGGGGGGWDDGGAGGAGGLALQTGRSFSATNYTCTVGAGGNGGTAGVIGYNGGNSTLDTITATGGGGGGTGNAAGGRSGANGGSGGGGSYVRDGGGGGGFGGTGITGTSGGATLYGSAGGTGYNTSPYGTGGGGGAGAVGGNGSGSAGGAGGNGRTDSLINAIGAATGVGQLVESSYYIAGGGGGSIAGSNPAGAGGYGGGSNGGNTTASTNARVNTGGGGGADGSNGGSGVIVIRYLKA